MNVDKDQRYQRSWEECALLDPKWAIATRSDKKYGKWGDEEFFASGRIEIERALSEIEAHNLEVHYGRALDFGCGMGRLTRALSSHFSMVDGVDCSATMISNARQMHPTDTRITFHERQSHDLKLFNDNEFDLVFSLITLQHIPNRSALKQYLEDFIRVAKPGGIIYFSLPTVRDYPQLKEWFWRIRGALYTSAMALGLPREYLYYKLRLKPFTHMNHLPAEDVESLCRPHAEAFVVLDNQTVATRYMVKKTMVSSAHRDLEVGRDSAAGRQERAG